MNEDLPESTITRDLLFREIRRALEAVMPDRAELLMRDLEKRLPADGGRAELERGIWTTKSGDKLTLREMSDGHLTNTMGMLVRQIYEKSSEPYSLQGAAELAARRNPIFPLMVKEAERRGLTWMSYTDPALRAAFRHGEFVSEINDQDGDEHGSIDTHIEAAFADDVCLGCAHNREHHGLNYDGRCDVVISGALPSRCPCVAFVET